MKLMMRLVGLTIFFITIQFQSFGQKADLGKQFFPDNKHAQWLVNLQCQPVSKKVWKRFKKKIGDLNKNENQYDSYRGRVYTKKSSSSMWYESTTYKLNCNSNSTYSSMSIRRNDEKVPLFNFMNAPTIKDLEQKINTNSSLELAKIERMDPGGILGFFHHDWAWYVKVSYDKTSGRLYEVEISTDDYDYEKDRFEKELEKDKLLKNAQKAEQYTEGLRVAAEKILAATDVRFDERFIHVSPDQVRLYDSKVEDEYQVINMRYEGPLQNGLPHGIANWGVAKSGEIPHSLNKHILEFVAKGSFENGKPVGEHLVNKGDKTMVYTYEAGRLKEAREKGGKFHVYFKDDGSQDEVSDMSFNYSTWIGLKYSGKIDKNLKPHDTNGVLSFGQSQETKAHFEHGVLKKTKDASFTYGDVVLTGVLNNNLQFNGKVNIQGYKKDKNYNGYIYLLNGKPDFSKEGHLKFDDFRFSNDLNGKFEIRGKIIVNDYANGFFEGKDLDFSFVNFPNTKFKGDLIVSGNGVLPTGWHTVTEYQNGVPQGSLKGRYSLKGSFLEGDNFYQMGKSWIYDAGSFTDSRNGKEYPYKTFVKENGDLITWMMEDIYYENYTNEVWGYGSGISRKRKCYYSKRNSKIACPSGWRLPNSDDVRFIKSRNTRDNKYITDNETLISVLNLDRNGYVWKKYRGTEMHQEEEGVFFWLNSGYYISISKLNQGSSTTLDADERFHTCRCVKDGAVKN